MMTCVRIWRAATAALVAAAWAATPAASEPIDYYQVEGVDYDASVPLPEDTFRHGVGERPILHERFVDYLTLLADSSERITAETIGYSHQGRPILLFTVTSPENHARIEELRAAHFGRLTGAWEADPDAPAVVWLHFGVHGAEPSG
ncbi:MAG: hypothetical protein MI723_11980, partial [Caulobacterales bacterium]|nr:hypothetical protein [Caulobacterales bacterium]